MFLSGNSFTTSGEKIKLFIMYPFELSRLLFPNGTDKWLMVLEALDFRALDFRAQHLRSLVRPRAERENGTSRQFLPTFRWPEDSQWLHKFPEGPVTAGLVYPFVSSEYS